MSEFFQPIANLAPKGVKGKMLFYGRLLAVFQALTVLRDMKSFLPYLEGKVMDIGCGDSPYAHLINHDTATYIAVDTYEESLFGYKRADLTVFDGRTLPFSDDSIDHVICSEVFEHVREPRLLANESHRVLKIGGTALITIPWSARFHYKPNDYQRLTPTAIILLFDLFKNISIKERGTDIVSIANKVIVIFCRCFYSNKKIQWLSLAPFFLASPILIFAILIGHLSLMFGIGSPDDPLGYTIKLVK